MSTTTSTARPVRRPGVVLAVMCSGMFVVLLDVTVVNVALPSIGPDLHAGPTAMAWVVDAYAVAIAALLLVGGTLGDRIGHRRVVVAGLVVFALASAGCALAPGVGALVAARALQGVGAAVLLPGTLAVIADAFPDRAGQARAVGIWSGVSSLALPAGPLLGGLLVSAGGWRLVFWLNPPVVAAALVAIGLLVPGGSGRGARPGDGPGLGTVAAGLLRRPAFVGPNLAALIMNFVINGTLFVTTLYLQSVQHRSPISAGTGMLPLFLPLAVLAPGAGRLIARWGPGAVMSLGAPIAALGSAALVLLTPTGSYAVLLPALLGLGVGAALFTSSVVAAALRGAPADRSGLASGVTNTARQIGTAAGVAVFGAVAGSPAEPDSFVTALHRLGIGGAVAWGVAAALGVASAGGVRRPQVPQ